MKSCQNLTNITTTSIGSVSEPAVVLIVSKFVSGEKFWVFIG